MSGTDELVTSAGAYAATLDKRDLPARPVRPVAFVVCMDARLNPYGLFGLREGDAHVIRNAGGTVTDDVVRSLVISQRLLGTTEVVLVHHADCGMRTFAHDDFRRVVYEDTGIRPPWATEAFHDPAEDVRQSIARIKANPFIPHKDAVRGFVFDDKTGRLAEVEPPRDP